MSDDNIIPFKKPANDARPPRAINLPPVTAALAITLITVQAVCTVLPESVLDAVLPFLVFVPANLVIAPLYAVPTLVSYGFLHAGWLHLLMNLAMLVAMGALFERTLGGRKMLLLCLGGTVAGAIAQFAIGPHSPMPMVGASGAVAALFGGYIMLQPTRQARQRMALVLVGLFAVSAIAFIPIGGDSQSIAWAAHLGGLVSGAALTSRWLR